jgi:spermidine synthase
MPLPTDTWFTEPCEEGGSAFSLRTRRKLHQEQSPYQKIEVYETDSYGNLLVIDGFIMLSSRDNFLYHEMMCHPALFTHPDPRRVLIVGGGDCGTLTEVLKHPAVEQVTQVDIDERVTRVSEQFFPELCASNGDPRARLLFEDGVRFVAGQQSGCVDVVIVDSTDPIGPGEALFSQDFYAECRRLLGADGLLVQQSESPFYHLESIIKPMYRRMRDAGFVDVLSLQFPQPVYASGWWTCILACRDMTIGTFREQAVEERTFVTRYYNAAIHRAAMAMPEFMRQGLLAL